MAKHARSRNSTATRKKVGTFAANVCWVFVCFKPITGIMLLFLLNHIPNNTYQLWNNCFFKTEMHSDFFLLGFSYNKTGNASFKHLFINEKKIRRVSSNTIINYILSKYEKKFSELSNSNSQ